jgi:signal transduction histidine kinase
LRAAGGAWSWKLARGMIVARAEDGTPCRVSGTQKDISRIKAVETALLELTGQLDARVQERTAELHARQRELETTIDELRRTQSELIEAEKMASLGRLVAGVAHEVNTPLGVGLTALTFLRDQLARVRAALNRHLQPEQTDALLAPVDDAGTMAESNLVRAANLVKSFKQVAVDQSSSSIRAVGVRGYLEGTLQSLLPALRKAGHRVTIECDAALEMTNRPDALYQVIATLVLNSIQHAYPDGRHGAIRIAVEADAGLLKLTYGDDGVGMDAAVARRVFEPFFTTKRGSGGSGLGLHIVYNLVTQALAGRIQCSTAPGQGVRFDVAFPRLHPQAARQAG